MLSEIPLNPKANREATTQIMFETFKVPAMFLVNQGVLSLYGNGLTSGTVLHCGNSVTSSVPIFEGYAIPQGICNMNLAGLDLTNYLLTLMNKRGYPLPSSQTRMVRKMKEKLCYVAQEFDQERKKDSSTLEKSYQLPDGTTFFVGTERFQCPEVLFQPSLLERNDVGIHEMVRTSIEKCDEERQAATTANIILSGGTAELPGFTERLQKEIALVTPTQHKKLKITASQECVYCVWIGGSILTSLSSFCKMWITKKEYDEHGPSISQRFPL